MDDSDNVAGEIIGFLFVLYLIVQIVKILIAIAIVVGTIFITVKALVWVYQVIQASMENNVREYCLQKERELQLRSGGTESLQVKGLSFEQNKEE